MVEKAGRKGFIKTLEAVVAASIFFIFILNAVPAISGAEDTGAAVKEELSRQLESLDREGTLRQDVVNKDLAGIEDDLEGDFAGYRMAIGLSYLGMSDGRYNGGGLTESFDVNKSRAEKEVLRLWVEEDQGIDVSINGNSVISSPGTGYTEVNIESDTVDGGNTLEISGSGNLFYRIDKYNYMQNGDLPEDRSINSMSYTLAGEEGSFQPSELRVYLWR